MRGIAHRLKQKRRVHPFFTVHGTSALRFTNSSSHLACRALPQPLQQSRASIRSSTYPFPSLCVTHVSPGFFFSKKTSDSRALSRADIKTNPPRLRMRQRLPVGVSRNRVNSTTLPLNVWKACAHMFYIQGHSGTALCVRFRDVIR